MAEVASPSSRGLGHTVAPSMSGPGMAGQGAYTYGATDSSAALPSALAAAAAAGAAGGAVAAGLQERPKYVYGQTDPSTTQGQADDDMSEHAHGVYSSEPQVQQTYNAETYGSYAAYDTPAHGGEGYMEATREYQGQEGQYAQDGTYVAQGGQEAYPDYSQYQNHPYGNGQTYAGYDANAQQGYAGYDANAQQYDPNQQYEPNQQYDQNQPYDQGQYAQYDQNAYAAQGAPAQARPNNDAYGGM